MIILDNNGNSVGRGNGSMPLAAGWSYVSETPELLAQLPADVGATEAPYTINRNALLKRLEAAGKLDAFLDLLDLPANRKAKAFFYASLDLRSDDPVFLEFSQEIIASLELTEAQANEFLAP